MTDEPADAGGALTFEESLTVGGLRSARVGVVGGTCGRAAAGGSLATAGGFIAGDAPIFGGGFAAETCAGGGLLTGFTAGTGGRTAGADRIGLAFGFPVSSSVGGSPALTVGGRDIGP